MKAEFSSLNSRLSVLESSTKVRVDPVPPSPESQEDEVDREDDEIKTMIVNAINKKPEKHEFNTVVDNISNRQMVEIGG
jgi:hypothetical protein